MSLSVETEVWYHDAQMERLRLRALIQRSHETCSNLTSAHHRLSEVTARSRELVASSRVERMARREAACQTTPEPEGFLQILQTAGLCEADLPTIVDNLIEVYENAALSGDEKAVALFGSALLRIGRHIAQELGPRQAGVLLN